MIKVLHIISDLNKAGAQTVVMNIFRYLKNDPELDMTIAVLVSPSNTEYEKEARDNNYRVRFCNFKPSNTIPILDMLLNWIQLQRTVYNIIKDEKPDIVHTHSTALLPYVVFPIVFAGVKSRIHTLHSDPYAFSKRFVMWAKLAFKWLGFYPLCVSSVQADKACRRYGVSNIKVIKNGIDEKRFVPSNNRQVIRSILGVRDSTFLVGSVGRLDKIKNYNFLLKIFSEYLNFNRDAFLVLIGEGDERKNLEDKAKELGISNNILLLGQKRDVEKYYYAMDLFMLTSFFESFSIVTVEAQFAGVRCVVADSIPEDVVITNKVNRLSLNEPIEKWIKAMQGLINPDKQVGSLDDFSMNKTAIVLKKLYLSINEKAI